MVKELLNLYDLELAWKNSLFQPTFFFRMGENHNESLKVEKMLKRFCGENDKKISFYRFFIPQQETLCEKLVQLTWVKKSFPQLLLVDKQELIWYKSGENISSSNLSQILSQIFPIT